MPAGFSAFISSVHAGTVQVNFSGGSGTPLTITLPQSVSYTVTAFPGTGGELLSSRAPATC